jgi:23S rRNA pseudouridine2605 synthase
MEPQGIRLQKVIADHGICSRRKAEELITEGRVFVNGRAAELGQRVFPGKDAIKVNGRLLQRETVERVVLMLNKPRGFVCTNADPHNPQTVFDLVPPPWNRQRLFCAGRLDKESEGMLLLTNDGEFAQRLTHPSGMVVKRYLVTLSKPLQAAHIPKLLEGVKVEGELLRALKIIPATTGENPERRLEVHLGQGRKREIRRMFEFLGYFVDRLRRVQIGCLVMRGIAKGRVRPLKNKEVDLLFS